MTSTWPAGESTIDPDSSMGKLASHLVRNVPRLEERAGQALRPPQVGSAYAFDDELADPFAVSASVGDALVAGLDQLGAVTDALVASSLRSRATFALTRCAIENAALAHWMLVPERPEDRVLRCLQQVTADMGDRLQAARLVKPSRGEEVNADLRMLVIQAAERIGVSPDVALGRAPGWGRIVASVGTHVQGASDTELWWRLCSGFAHARNWVQLEALEVVPASEPTRASGLGTLELRANETVLGMCLLRAFKLLEAGVREHERRRLHWVMR